ncbi:hypothetical protein GCM10010400_16800 [Streptomyces aculeolatus]
MELLRSEQPPEEDQVMPEERNIDVAWEWLIFVTRGAAGEAAAAGAAAAGAAGTAAAWAGAAATLTEAPATRASAVSAERTRMWNLLLGWGVVGVRLSRWYTAG